MKYWEGLQDKRELSQWFDEEYEQVIVERNEARRRSLQLGTRRTAAQYSEARRRAKYVMRRKKKEFFENKLRWMEGIMNPESFTRK
jgi:hypothetical protein